MTRRYLSICCLLNLRFILSAEKATRQIIVDTTRTTGNTQINVKKATDSYVRSLHERTSHLRGGSEIESAGYSVEGNEESETQSDATKAHRHDPDGFLESSNFEQLLTDILATEGVSSVLKTATRIPAILSNFDGALQITQACLFDARLACTAIYKLAAEAIRGADLSPDDCLTFTVMTDPTKDRRFEQLLEVIQCQMGSLPASDLSKIIWGLAMLSYRCTSKFYIMLKAGP